MYAFRKNHRRVPVNVEEGGGVHYGSQNKGWVPCGTFQSGLRAKGKHKTGSGSQEMHPDFFLGPFMDWQNLQCLCLSECKDKNLKQG